MNRHDSFNFNTSIDNQATIKFLQNNRPQPAQYLINEIKRNIIRLNKEHERLQKRARRANPNLTITFTWVAGHMDSEGNESADGLAKGAAEFSSSDQRLPNSFAETSLSASVQQLDENKARQ